MGQPVPSANGRSRFSLAVMQDRVRRIGTGPNKFLLRSLSWYRGPCAKIYCSESAKSLTNSGMEAAYNGFARNVKRKDCEVNREEYLANLTLPLSTY